MNERKTEQPLATQPKVTPALMRQPLHHLIQEVTNERTLGVYSDWQVKRELVRAKLQVLRAHLLASQELAEYEAERHKGAMIAAIDTNTDMLKTKIQSVYTAWLAREGMRMKTESLLALNEAGERLEGIKATIMQGKAGDQLKEIMVKTADVILMDLFRVLFTEAAQQVLAKETGSYLAD